MGGYLVLDWLGSGAGAQVYRARDLRTDRLVALKTTGPELLRVPSTAGRWAREVGACAQVVHPNVVRTHGSGVTRDGVAYLVMELVEGGSPVPTLEAFDGLGPLVKVLAKAPEDRPHPVAVARRLAAVSGASIRA